MPLIDVECTACATISEVMRPLAMHPATPACPKCDQPTVQIHLPSCARTLPPAVVVYRAPDGSFRFPGDVGGSASGKYDRLGYERIEARGWAEVRSLETRLSTRERSLMARKLERQQAFAEAGEKIRRSDSYNGTLNGFRIPVQDAQGHIVGHKIVHMSDQGKAILRHAIDRNNHKPRESFRDVRIHVDAYSNSARRSE